MKKDSVFKVKPKVQSTVKKASDIIATPEACELLGIHRNTLYRLIQAEEVPAFKMHTGGQWRFKRSDLEEWLENRKYLRRSAGIRY